MKFVIKMFETSADYNVKKCRKQKQKIHKVLIDNV